MTQQPGKGCLPILRRDGGSSLLPSRWLEKQLGCSERRANRTGRLRCRLLGVRCHRPAICPRTIVRSASHGREVRLEYRLEQRACGPSLTQPGHSAHGSRDPTSRRSGRSLISGHVLKTSVLRWIGVHVLSQSPNPTFSFDTGPHVMFFMKREGPGTSVLSVPS